MSDNIRGTKSPTAIWLRRVLAAAVILLLTTTVFAGAIAAASSMDDMESGSTSTKLFIDPLPTDVAKDTTITISGYYDTTSSKYLSITLTEDSTASSESLYAYVGSDGAWSTQLSTSNLNIGRYTLLLSVDGEKITRSINIVEVRTTSNYITASTNLLSYLAGEEDVYISGSSSYGNDLYAYIDGENIEFTKLIQSPTSYSNIISINRFSWSYTVSGEVFKSFNAGTYTIYISTKKDASSINDLETYTTVPLVLKRSLMSIDEKPEKAIKGQKYSLAGTIDLADELAVYIYGDKFFAFGDMNGILYSTDDVLNGQNLISIDNGNFNIGFDIPQNTDQMPIGKYFMVIQHPMYDDQFDIRANGENIFARTTSLGADSDWMFLFDTVNRPTSKAMTQALKATFNCYKIDDTYTELSFDLVGAPVTSITAEIDAESYYIGDKVTIRGTSESDNSLYAYIDGNGYSFSRLNKDKSSSNQISVVDGAWAYEISGDMLNLNNGTYTIYISTKSNAQSVINLDSYTTVSLVLKQPCVNISEPEKYAVVDTTYTIEGTAEGTDTLRYYIFGDGFFRQGDVDVIDDAFVIDYDLQNVKIGQYYILIQHPMANKEYNVEVDDTLPHTVYRLSNGVKSSSFSITSYSSSSAVQQFTNVFNRSDIDDSYVQHSFFVAKEIPPLTLHSIPAVVTTNSQLAISGQTNLGSENNIRISITSNGGSVNYVNSYTSVDDNGLWKLSPKSFSAGDYTITATIESYGFSETKTFTVVDDSTHPYVSVSSNIINLGNHDYYPDGYYISINGKTNVDKLYAYIKEEKGEFRKLIVDDTSSNQIDVRGVSWSSRIYGSEFNQLPHGIHLIYISNTEDAKSVDELESYGIIIIQKPIMFYLTDETNMVLSNTEYIISGIAEDTEEIGYDIIIGPQPIPIGSYHFKDGKISVEDGKFTFTHDVKDMANGEYSLILKHPKNNQRIHCTFKIVDIIPEYNINPIPSEIVVGSKFNVSGTTNLGEGKTVIVELLSTTLTTVPKETAGSDSYAVLKTKTDENGNWKVEFDTSALRVDWYIISVSIDSADPLTPIDTFSMKTKIIYDSSKPSNSIIHLPPQNIPKGSMFNVSGWVRLGSGIQKITAEMYPFEFDEIPEKDRDPQVISLNTTPDENGNWSITFDTSGLSIGTYYFYVITTSSSGSSVSSGSLIYIIDWIPNQEIDKLNISIDNFEMMVENYSLLGVDTHSVTQIVNSAKENVSGAINAGSGNEPVAYTYVENGYNSVKNAEQALAVAGLLAVSENINNITVAFNTLYERNQIIDAMFLETKVGSLRYDYDTLMAKCDIENNQDSVKLYSLVENSFSLLKTANSYLNGGETDQSIPTSISLHSGWNFISIPKTLNASCDTAGKVFSNIETGNTSILGYDAKTGWYTLSRDSPIKPLDAYWIYSVAEVTVPLKYEDNQKSRPATKQLYQGWNAVGISSNYIISAKTAFADLNWLRYIPWNVEAQDWGRTLVMGGSARDSEENDVSLGNGAWLYMKADGTYTGNAV